MEDNLRKRLKMKRTATKCIALTFVWLVILLLYVPLIMVVIYSFTESRSVGVWNGFSTELYSQMFKNDKMMAAFGNTFMIAGIAALLATLIGSISSVGIHYLSAKKKKAAMFINEITVINADIVTAVSLMLLFRFLNIRGGYATLIISHTVITIPYVILSVLPRLNSLNPSLYDAGQDLGAGVFKTMFKVIFPQLIPAMISGFMLSFVISLDDFVITKFTNGSGAINTISTYIYSMLPKGSLPASLRALSTIILGISFAALIGYNLVSKKKRKKEAK